MLFFAYALLLRDQWMIERLSEAMSAALVGDKILPIPLKFLLDMQNVVMAQKLHTV